MQIFNMPSKNRQKATLVYHTLYYVLETTTVNIHLINFKHVPLYNPITSTTKSKIRFDRSRPVLYQTKYK